MTSSSSPRFTGFIRDVRSSKPLTSQQSISHGSSNTSHEPVLPIGSTRTRTESSNASAIDPFHYQALQDTNEALKSEVQRLARADEENMIKLKEKAEQYVQLQRSYEQLQNDLTRFHQLQERFDELEKIFTEERKTYEYCQRENEQLRNQNEHLLNELTRLTQIENRDRARSIEQVDLRRQYDELLNQFNELRENNSDFENNFKRLNDENNQIRLENDQFRSANDLLREEMNQMKQSHETILKKRHEEIKYLQNENRDLQIFRQRYNEERETLEALDLKKTQLENDLLTMQVVEDRCQELQSTVERLQSEIQHSQKKSDDHTLALANLNKENTRLIKELESASMLNTQMRTEISNASQTNERLIEECERSRTNLQFKTDEYETKRRENEQNLRKIQDLETMIKSLRDTNDLQKQLNVENEVNKQELKRKQDDFEQFQRMHDVTKRENQETIHLLEEKIYDLERKTELQSLKHEEILLEFESLKARRDRILPPSSSSIMTNHHPHHPSSLSSSPHHWPLPTMVDSQTSPTDELAYPPLTSTSTTNISQTLPTISTTSSTTVSNSTTPVPPQASLPNPTTRSLSMTRGMTSLANTSNEIQEIKHHKVPFNNLSAQIVVAKYSYEPLQYSPNDHPEVELPLNIGDYYLIYGDVDEDGFYDGRNLEGRYGLIPSNFIEPVTNMNELPETVRHIIHRLTGKIFPDDTLSLRRDPPTSTDLDAYASNTSISVPSLRKSTLSSNGNLAESSSTNGLTFGKHVPSPSNLRVEKSLTNSVLIAWNPPSTNIPILGYQVLLDHLIYTTTRANERTRALIENINVNEKIHRISIRTITQRGLSRDQECTLVLNMSGTTNNDSCFAPSDLRVDRINQTSAVVSWWPASNDVVHKLLVNDIEVQTLKAGVYRFKLSGLTPNTSHKVSIKAKPTSNVNNQQQLAASIEFRTTSFDESIEPPKRVQAIAGPQSNTLLVSWEQPSSTIATARGYRVLVDGRHLQDITNPTNDHTVINTVSLHHGKYLTVRTLTENNGESHDSTPVDLDDILAKLDMDQPAIPTATTTGTTPMVTTATTMVGPLPSEETFDKESIALTASSSLTLRTTSDDEMTTFDPLSMPNEPYQKLSRAQEIVSPSSANISPSTRQSVAMSPQTPPVIIPSSPAKTSSSHSDRIRPISKTSTRPSAVTPIQSPSKSSSTTSSMNTDVPQIEINSPSPNSPVVTPSTVNKSKNLTRDSYDQPQPPQQQQQQRFGYDSYVNKPPQQQQQQEEITSNIKSPNAQRKTSKAATTISPVKQREHIDSKRPMATPINGNPSLSKNKISAPRHASTSSEEQHTAPPTPMRPMPLKEQQVAATVVPTPIQQQQQQQQTTLVNSHLINKPNQPARLFIALFDYDPNAMSPNKDNDEELPFKEGQLIRIYGDQDADGFYVGETENGRTGFVPSNMVSEIQLDDAEIEAHLFNRTSNRDNSSRMTGNVASPITPTTNTTKRTSPAANAMPSPAVSVAPAPTVKTSATPSIKKMIAMFDYNATENSPNANPDEELSFHAGDIIYVYGNVHDDGFYYGQLESGSKGLVPSNFLKEVAMNTDDDHHHHHHSQQENDSMPHIESKKTSHRR